jgi:hypothetical protein
MLPQRRPVRARPGCQSDMGRCSINDDAADRFATGHQIESIVDLFERHHMGDQIIDIDLLVHVPVDDLGHIGTPAGTASPATQSMLIIANANC